MIFLDFEKDLESLYEQLEKIRQIGEKGDLDVVPMIEELEGRIAETRATIYGSLTGWQRVQLSRHPERPYTLYYIKQIATDFLELHGDRCFGDDKAMVGGIGQLDGRTVVFIGQQKGVNTKLRQYRNFGMSNPEGYRKALRLMRLAERFGFPVVSLIDTPGAFPGIEAEQRGQAEAIARNLFEMAQLRVPIVSVVIGEGASGGAIGIGLSDRSYMMENTWYSVISPESCSSILWRSWDQKERAAEELHLTAEDMLRFGIIDGVVPEPTGGAHADPEAAAAALKRQIVLALEELETLGADERVASRIDKYDNIGVYREGDRIQYHSATPLPPEVERRAMRMTAMPTPTTASFPPVEAPTAAPNAPATDPTPGRAAAPPEPAPHDTLATPATPPTAAKADAKAVAKPRSKSRAPAGAQSPAPQRDNGSTAKPSAKKPRANGSTVDKSTPTKPTVGKDKPSPGAAPSTDASATALTTPKANARAKRQRSPTL